MAGALYHEALLYRDLEEYAAGVSDFLRRGIAAGEPVMASVPASRHAVIRGALGPAAERVRFLDMTQVGRNPGRIIPMVRDWLDQYPGGRRSFVGEPIWEGRRPSETVEAVRHEALLNVAFAGSAVSILCPYDATALPADVLADAERTHPVMACAGHRRESDDFRDPLEVYAADDAPLPPAAADAAVMPVTENLRSMRALVRAEADRNSFEEGRLADFLVAVNEATTNTLIHGGAPGVLRVWHERDELICEIADGGRITDPLAGRRRPDLFANGGRGLWLMNQLCDLVQLRPSATGTTLRLHLRAA